MRLNAIDFMGKQCKEGPGSLVCSIRPFQKLQTALQKYLVQIIYEKFHGSTEKLTTEQVEEILGIIKKARTGSQKFIGNRLNIAVSYGKIMFQKDLQRKEALPEKRIELPIPGTITYPGGKIITKLRDHLPKHTKKNAIYITLREQENTFYIRRVTPGDRLQPAGLNGTKKIQDIFVDEKIPRDHRNNIPVIVDSKGNIVAVGTIRIDQSYHPKFFSGPVVEIEFEEE